MRNLIRLLVPLFLSCAAAPALALSCSLSANPAQLKGIFNNTSTLQLQGTIVMSCTRGPGDPRKPNFWIGMDQAGSGRTATLDTGGSTLAYTVAHGDYGRGIWMNTGSEAPGSNNNGGVQDNSPDFGNTGMTLTETYTYYLQVLAPQGSKAAGVYLDRIPLTLRQNNINGVVLDSTSLDISISIPKACRFSTPPTPITVNYTAFSPTPVAGTSMFALTCTLGTTYTIALDRTRSVIPSVELAYDLSLSAVQGTGIAAEQGYTVDISVDAGQPGRCNVATCTGTDTRTLTISY
jgi:spore coat protein U-like protein